MRPRSLLTALVTVVALSTAACGDSDESSSSGTTGATAPTVTATNPVATAPEATTPPPDATEPGARTIEPPPETAPADPPPANTAPAEVEPQQGASERDPVRVPATYTIGSGRRLEPQTITVPPFLAVEISFTAADGEDHEVVVNTPEPTELTVTGGRRASVRVPGLRAGRYAIEVDGAEAGTLVAGGEVGP